jgi:uncharacterized protein involved in cysteine biosynthesis
MKNTITKSLQDIFSPEVLKFVLKIGFGSIMITGLFIYFFWSTLSSFITSYLSWIPWEWLQTTGAGAATIALAYMLIIIMISILTSLYAEPLLIKLAKKHYPSAKVIGSPNISTSVYLSIKSGVIFLLIFMFTFPIIFIPIVGQVYMLWLWSIIIKEPTAYDVSSLFIADKKIVKEKTKKSRIIAMIASLFNYVPVLNIFAPVFAQILFLHQILGEKNSHI